MTPLRHNRFPVDSYKHYQSSVDVFTGSCQMLTYSTEGGTRRFLAARRRSRS